MRMSRARRLASGTLSSRAGDVAEEGEMDREMDRENQWAMEWVMQRLMPQHMQRERLLGTRLLGKMGKMLAKMRMDLRMDLKVIQRSAGASVGFYEAGVYTSQRSVDYTQLSDPPPTPTHPSPI